MKDRALEKCLTEKRSAIAAHAWLQSLDPGLLHRTELLAAGVSPQIAASLYPPTFEALTPALLTHLHAQDLSGLAAITVDIDSSRQTVEELLDHLPEHLSERWETQWLAQRNEPIAPVVSELYPLLDRDVDAAATLAETLWHTWWLMTHLAELSPIMHGAVHHLMAWLSQNLLHPEAAHLKLA